MKFLFRFFISICIFLLTGYGQMHANAHEQSLNCASEKNLVKPNHAGLDLILTANSTTYKAVQSFDQAENKIRATDNESEEDELASASKKSLELNKYFTIAFCSQASVSFYHHVKKSIPVSEHFFSFSSYRRYIAFRVIRI